MGKIKLFILGCGGFIGSNLIKYLLNFPKYEICGLDNDSMKLDEIKDKFHYIEGDIRKNDKIINKTIINSDIVIDLIAYANPIIYVQNPIEVVDLNFFQNLKIVNSCIKYKKRLIQFSSCEVYGMTGNYHSPIIFNEENSNLILGPIKNQRWIYSCAKQLLERILYAHGDLDELNYTIIRPFNFIGPKMDYLIKKEVDGCPRVPAQFISCLLYGRNLKLVDGGKNYRTYLYIDDASRAIKLVIDNEKGFFNNQIVNIGNPNNETTIENLAYIMIDIYEKITGMKFKYGIEEVSSEVFYGKGYEDCDRRIPDISKLRKIGWSPKHDLRETIKLTLNYYIDKVIDLKNS